MTYVYKHDTFRFRNNEHYEGEALFGGCGYVNRNVVHVLKRTKNHIVYRDSWGKTHKTRRLYHIKCEFFRNSFESFYADSVGEHMRFKLEDKA